MTKAENLGLVGHLLTAPRKRIHMDEINSEINDQLLSYILDCIPVVLPLIASSQPQIHEPLLTDQKGYPKKVQISPQ